MVAHEMDAQAAVALVGVLEEHQAGAVVGGGWGVDALLGRQTRPHADLDLWVPADRFHRTVAALVATGVDQLYPQGDDRPWNFVLHDGDRRRVDLHAYETIGDGSFHYGPADGGDTFPMTALDGEGSIDGRPVRCETAVWSVQWHTGYPPRAEDRHDVPLLCAEFGIDLPAGFS